MFCTNLIEGYSWQFIVIFQVGKNKIHFPSISPLIFGFEIIELQNWIQNICHNHQRPFEIALGEILK